MIIPGVPIFVELSDSISTDEIKNSRDISHKFSLFFDLPTEFETATDSVDPPPFYMHIYIFYCRGYTNFGIHENTMFLQPTKIGIQQLK